MCTLFNFWKMGEINKKLLPPLMKEGSDSKAILLLSRYKDWYLLDRFDSSPGFFW